MNESLKVQCIKKLFTVFFTFTTFCYVATLFQTVLNYSSSSKFHTQKYGSRELAFSKYTFFQWLSSE